MRSPRRESVASMLAKRLPRRSATRWLAGGAVAGVLAGSPFLLTRRGISAQAATPPAGASAFIVLRRYQLLAGETMDELVRRVNEGFVPIVSKIPGFREYILVDAGNGAHLTISLFDDQSGAEASTSNAADWAAENVAELIEGPAEVTEGWVRIQVSRES